jgi:hypothetical protein
MNLFVIDPSRSVAKSSGKKTGPTVVTKLLAATPGVPVSIRYGSFPELEMTDDEQPVLREADFTVNKTEEGPAGVVRLSGHVGDDDNSVEATVTVYKRYNRLALLCMSV